jgi:hypothetical protein
MSEEGRGYKNKIKDASQLSHKEVGGCKENNLWNLLHNFK